MHKSRDLNSSILNMSVNFFITDSVPNNFDGIKNWISPYAFLIAIFFFILIKFTITTQLEYRSKGSMEIQNNP